MAEEANTETVETVVSKEETKGNKESFLKQGIPEFKQGDTVKVYQKIKEKNKERIQIFEGQILAVKHGRGLNGTITVR